MKYFKLLAPLLFCSRAAVADEALHCTKDKSAYECFASKGDEGKRILRPTAAKSLFALLVRLGAPIVPTPAGDMILVQSLKCDAKVCTAFVAPPPIL